MPQKMTARHRALMIHMLDDEPRRPSAEIDLLFRRKYIYCNGIVTDLDEDGNETSAHKTFLLTPFGRRIASGFNVEKTKRQIAIDNLNENRAKAKKLLLEFEKRTARGDVPRLIATAPESYQERYLASFDPITHEPGSIEALAESFGRIAQVRLYAIAKEAEQIRDFFDQVETTGQVAESTGALEVEARA